MDFVDCHIDVDCFGCQFHKTREQTKDMTFEVAKVSYWPSFVHTERRLHWRSLKRWGEPSVGEPVSLKSCGSEVVPKLWTGNVQPCRVLLESNQPSKLYFLKCPNPIEFIPRQHEEPGVFLYSTRKDITKYCFNLLDHLFFVPSTQHRLLLDSCHLYYQSV